jgi:ketosteroid isomerase-like protein
MNSLAMRTLIQSIFLLAATSSFSQDPQPIVVHNHYYPKPGKGDEVFEWRLHASEVRAKLELPVGRVLKKVSGEGPDYVIWECEYPSMAAREADVMALDQSNEFKEVQAHMNSLIDKFDRDIWLLSSTAQTTDEIQIRENRRMSNAAIESHDTAAIAKHWSAGIVVVTSRNVHNVGRIQNSKAFAGDFKSKQELTYIRSPKKVEVYLDANTAAETGTWVGRWKNGSEQIVVGGSYYAKWTKSAGRWLIQSEMYTLLECQGNSYCSTL